MNEFNSKNTYDDFSKIIANYSFGICHNDYDIVKKSINLLIEIICLEKDPEVQEKMIDEMIKRINCNDTKLKILKQIILSGKAKNYGLANLIEKNQQKIEGIIIAL